MLKARNYDLGPSGVDGVFGSYTLAAVQAFQENKGIGVTGKIDDRTWEVLILPSRKRQRGSQVVALHERLYGKIISSFLAAEPDDTFSDQTEKAVRAFQAKYPSRLVVNGEADLDTWCALLERTLL
jgi:peptidoglycan hydrolase-like protein with peptidoglycan-binding domain